MLNARQKQAATQEADIPNDTFSLVIIGVVALIAFWLVFSLVRKVFGVVILIAVAVGGWLLWNDPALLDTVTQFFGGR